MSNVTLTFYVVTFLVSWTNRSPSFGILLTNNGTKIQANCLVLLYTIHYVLFISFVYHYYLLNMFFYIFRNQTETKRLSLSNFCTPPKLCSAVVKQIQLKSLLFTVNIGFCMSSWIYSLFFGLAIVFNCLYHIENKRVQRTVKDE